MLLLMATRLVLACQVYACLTEQCSDGGRNGHVRLRVWWCDAIVSVYVIPLSRAIFWYQTRRNERIDTKLVYNLRKQATSSFKCKRSLGFKQSSCRADDIRMSVSRVTQSNQEQNGKPWIVSVSQRHNAHWMVSSRPSCHEVQLIHRWAYLVSAHKSPSDKPTQHRNHMKGTLLLMYLRQYLHLMVCLMIGSLLNLS